MFLTHCLLFFHIDHLLQFGLFPSLFLMSGNLLQNGLHSLHLWHLMLSLLVLTLESDLDLLLLFPISPPNISFILPFSRPTPTSIISIAIPISTSVIISSIILTHSQITSKASSPKVISIILFIPWSISVILSPLYSTTK